MHLIKMIVLTYVMSITQKNLLGLGNTSEDHRKIIRGSGNESIFAETI